MALPILFSFGEILRIWHENFLEKKQRKHVLFGVIQKDRNVI